MKKEEENIRYIKNNNYVYIWKEVWFNMCSLDRLKEIKESGLNLSEQTEKELKQTIEEGNKMSEENGRLFRSLLL